MAVTVGGTSITFNDGTTQTTAAGGAPTTAQVLSATAGASVGAVGTYAFLGTTDPYSTAAGGTKAGSSLRYAGVSGNVSWADTEIFGFIGVGSGGTPSGTWRAMGRSYGNNSDRLGATLWLRIS